METVLHKSEDRIKVNVGMTGKYGWEITCYGNDQLEVINRIDRINTALKGRFKNEE